MQTSHFFGQYLFFLWPWAQVIEPKIELRLEKRVWTLYSLWSFKCACTATWVRDGPISHIVSGNSKGSGNTALLIYMISVIFTRTSSPTLVISMILCKKIEPWHDKTNKMAVRPAKTQIRLGIRPVWSEASLSAWRKFGSLATHWVQAKTLIRLGGCPGWSESSLGAQSLCWFCHVTAHMQHNIEVTYSHLFRYTYSTGTGGAGGASFSGGRGTCVGQTKALCTGADNRHAVDILLSKVHLSSTSKHLCTYSNT